MSAARYPPLMPRTAALLTAFALLCCPSGCVPSPAPSADTPDTDPPDTDPPDTDPPDTDPPDTDAPPDDPAPDPACERLGCLREIALLGAWSRADLEPWLGAGVRIDNGYEVFVATYLTDAGRTATATVTLPFDPGLAAPDAGWSIVVNAHGTIGLDDACRLSGTVSGTALAGLFGARGAIGVAPDYPGLGSPGLHPYLDARSEGTSVLDAIRAAAQLARHVGAPHDGRSAVVGMSQGGHASLAAAALHDHYAPELDIRAFAAAAPASGYAEHWRSGVGVSGPHMVLHAMLAWSFAEVADADPAAIWADGSDPTDHLLSRCGWDPHLAGAPTLYDDFPTEPGRVFAADFLQDYREGRFERWPWFAEGFARSRLRPWLDEGEQTAPITIWQGTADVVVPLFMTEQLVDDLRAGGVQVDLRTVPGAGHVDTAFGFVGVQEQATDASIAWVQERLRAPAPRD